MKFSTRQDTDISAEALFHGLSDFPKMERMLMRRGTQVRRLDGDGATAVGSAWQIGFDWRGKARELSLTLAEYQPPERMAFSGSSDQFSLSILMTVVALAPSKSRLIFEVDVQPRGMKARLLLQTAKLGKAQLDRKFAQRIAQFVDNLAMRGAA